MKREALGNAFMEHMRTGVLSPEERLELERKFLRYFEKNAVTPAAIADFFVQLATASRVSTEYQKSLKELLLPIVHDFSQWLSAQERTTLESEFRDAVAVEIFLNQHADLLAYLNVEVVDGREQK